MTERMTRQKTLTLMVIFAAMAVAGYAVGGTVARREMELPAFADLMAILLAFFLTAMAAATGWMASDAERFKRNVEHRDDPDPVDPRTMRSFRLQSVACALAAALIVAPVIADGAGLIGGDDAGSWLTAGVMALLIVWQARVNWRIWREGDELTRNVLLLTGAITFAFVQIALFAHAALVRIGLMQDVGAWGLVMAMMAIYLTVSVVVSIRKGFGTPD